MKFELPGDGPQGDVRERFHAWIEAKNVPGKTETFSLASFVHHFDTYRAYDELPNIALFHYADLKRDLPGEMQRIADHLGIEVDPGLLPELAKTADFENMQRNAARFAPGADGDFWHDTQRFFNKGTSGQWREQVSADDDERFRKALAALLDPAEAAWLLGGATAHDEAPSS